MSDNMDEKPRRIDTSPVNNTSDITPKRVNTDKSTVPKRAAQGSARRAIETSTPRKFKFFWIVPLILALIGTFLVYNGLQERPKNNAPKLQTPIAVPTTVAPVGPVGEVKVIDRGKAGEVNQEKIVSPETMEPNHLYIPALGVYAYINTEGNVGTIDDSNNLVLPTAHQVTRYVDGSNVTDNGGNILLAGHVEWYGEQGALFNLGNIKAGNVAYVTDADNNVQEYKLVDAKQTYKDKFPQELLNKSKTGPKQLNIVTCTDLRLINGQWVYDENLIATFIPVD